jgi:hypothetical protein
MYCIVYKPHSNPEARRFLHFLRNASQGSFGKRRCLNLVSVSLIFGPTLDDIAEYTCNDLEGEIVCGESVQAIHVNCATCNGR